MATDRPAHWRHVTLIMSTALCIGLALALLVLAAANAAGWNSRRLLAGSSG